MCVHEGPHVDFMFVFVVFLNDPLLLQTQTIIYLDWQAGLVIYLLFLLF